MATNVSITQLLDATVAQIRNNFVPTSGPLTADKPIYSVQRYLGAEFTTEEGFKRGIAGRCPAVRVRYVGSKRYKTTTGRRVDEVESTFFVYVCSDAERTRDDRKSIIPVAEMVWRALGDRRLGLEIQPLVYRATDQKEDPMMLSFVHTFTTRHHVDYRIDPRFDVMDNAVGDIVTPEDDENPSKQIGEVAAIFD